MAPPTAFTRSACDRCHQKKIRCIMSRRRSVCDRCFEHGTTCIFSPPGRNGRPPRAQPFTDSALTSQAQLATRPTSVSSASSNHAEEQQAGMAGSPTTLHSSNSGPQAHLDHAPLNLEPFPNTLDTDLAFMEDGPFNRLSPVDSTLLGSCMNFDGDQPPPPQPPAPPTAPLATAEDSMMQDPFQRSSSFTPAPLDFPGRLDPKATGRHGAPGTEPPSVSETLRLLHVTQQRLREERSRTSMIISTSSSSSSSSASSTSHCRWDDFGTLFQLIEEIHDAIQRYFDALPHMGSKFPCDFGTAMAFAAAMGNAVEVYEFIARCAVMTPNAPSMPTPALSHPHPHYSNNLNYSHHHHNHQQPHHSHSHSHHHTHHQRAHSSASSYSQHGSLRHPEDSQQPSELSGLESPPATLSASVSSQEGNAAAHVRIGNFVPSDDVVRRILANVLLYQVSMSQTLLDQLRQHLVHAQSALLSSSSGMPGMNGDNLGVGSSADTPLLSFFTPELYSTVVQLLNQLQTRIAKLEPVAIAGMMQTKRNELH